MRLMIEFWKVRVSPGNHSQVDEILYGESDAVKVDIQQFSWSMFIINSTIQSINHTTIQSIVV